MSDVMPGLALAQPLAASPAPLLEAEGLVLAAAATDAALVDDVSLRLHAAEVHAVVGESGSGKSLTALALLDLLPPGIERRAGRVRFNGIELNARERRAARGHDIAAIFQDPQASLDPRWTVERYLADRLVRLRGLAHAEADAAMRKLLEQVGLAASRRLLKSFPHELSGGMAQRIMIAGALAGAPKVLIADEPTTALDVTTQAQILDLLEDVRQNAGLAILMITHDLGVVAEIAQRVTVMYGGHVMETGRVVDILGRPRHPYTAALLAAMPDMTAGSAPPTPIKAASAGPVGLGCPFAPRCEAALPHCAWARPPLAARGDGSYSACHLEAAHAAIHAAASPDRELDVVH